MNKNYQFIFILVMGGAALWAAFHFSSANNLENKLPISQPSTNRPLPAIDAQDPVSALAPAPAPAPPPEPEVLSFGPHLREIGDCLKINNSANQDSELKFSTLESSLRGELGEMVANSLDWKNVHILLPNGEKRRLRMEIEAVGEAGAGTRLHYYGVDNEDLPVPLPLTEEQSMNPSESFVASLENEGKVTLRQEARRGVFSKGAELYYTERNGTLTDLELSYQGKNVKCQDLQSKHGVCS
ncbi:MAG: hypothetical protein ACXVCD_13855, partial [Pseudobdellovibrionaceae bacterium]